MSGKVPIIIGCTGCGKASLARELAERTGAEILLVDSMKVYRSMDIGTAKPSTDLRHRIPHHVIDVVDPWEDFSVAQYVAHAERAIADIQRRGKPVLAVGGTPLYVKALTEGIFDGPGADREIRSRLHETAKQNGSDILYQRLQGVDPVAAGRIHPNDLRRIIRALEVHELTGQPISRLQTQWDRGQTRRPYVFIGLRRSREDQSERTNLRVGGMIRAGLVDEVRLLLAKPQPLSRAARQALGYAEIIRHLQGELTLAEATELIKINTRRFAKAQRTWFKRFMGTEWIDLAPESTATQVADKLVHSRGSPWLPSLK